MSKNYKNVLGGKLQLKGDPLPTKTIVKKKKKKMLAKPLEVPENVTFSEYSESAEQPQEETDHRTPSEIKYEQAQQKRLADTAKKMAAKSHREKIEEFNKKLANLSEHYDIPKVGPG